MTIYAIQGSDNADRISMSLQRGEGRFGWSNIESANLHNLRERIEQNGWESLRDEEKECYHDFLLEIEPDGYVVYINVPVCCVTFSVSQASGRDKPAGPV